MRPPLLRGANVVVIVADTFRADHLGLPGLTPSLDRLAAGGITLARAYAEAPLTVPARTAMVSGIFTHMERPWSPLRPEDRHLAEVLRTAGYSTHAVSDSPFKARWGFDRGFDTFVHHVGKCQHLEEAAVPAPDPAAGDPYLPAGESLGESSVRRQWQEWRRAQDRHRSRHHSAPPELTTEEALRMLRRPPAPPFLLWIDYFDPHEPWDPPPPWSGRRDPGFTGRKVVLPWTDDARAYTAGEIADIRARYAGTVAQLDHEVGRVLDAIDAGGLRQRTLVVFISDHGILLGEHGRVGKTGLPLYEELVRIPCIWRLPGVLDEGSTSDLLFTNADFAPTVCALLGLRWPQRPVELYTMDLDRPVLPDEGRDASPALRGESGVRSQVFCGAFAMRNAVVEPAMKFVDNGGQGDDELFDLAADPDEQRNLAGEVAADASRLRADVGEWRRRFFVNYRPVPDGATPRTRSAAVRGALRPLRRAARRLRPR